MTKTVPVPPALLRRLWIGLAASGLSLALTIIQGFFREGFDAWHQPICALSLGPGGWLQMLNMVVFGAVVLTTVAPWRRVLAGARGGTIYPVLTALVGASFIGVGIIPPDPAPGYDPEGLALQAPTALGVAHIAIAGITTLCTAIGFFVMGARLSRDPAWPRWTLYSWVAAFIAIGCITVFSIWSMQPRGFAGTFERVATLVPILWMFAFLSRLHNGAPLMIARRS